MTYHPGLKNSITMPKESDVAEVRLLKSRPGLAAIFRTNRGKPAGRPPLRKSLSAITLIVTKENAADSSAASSISRIKAQSSFQGLSTKPGNNAVNCMSKSVGSWDQYT